MNGGTLLISRSEKNHAYYKRRLAALGFPGVSVTALEKDAQYSLIRELRPARILMSARFYHCCTPFLMGALHRNFPKIKTSAVVLGEYPADIAMYFILNGVNSYITSFDGLDEFYKGLDEVANGRDYVSPAVVKRIEMRRVHPEPAGEITQRQKEVIRLVCCGFKDLDIADTLAISRRTVNNHKTDAFTSLNVTSAVELLRAALTLEIVRLEELYFYPPHLTVNPQPAQGMRNEE